jgi:hypothetical protein
MFRIDSEKRSKGVVIQRLSGSGNLCIVGVFELDIYHKEPHYLHNFARKKKNFCFSCLVIHFFSVY